MIRVLIVAAYASVRAGLHALLADAGDCEVIGAVSGSAELERLLPDARPDVVLLDDNDGDATRVLALLSGGEAGLVVLGEERGGWLALAGAAEGLGQALPRMVEIGGSHAQRDLFGQIWLDALMRQRTPAALRTAQDVLQQQCNGQPESRRLARQVAGVYAALGLPSVVS